MQANTTVMGQIHYEKIKRNGEVDRGEFKNLIVHNGLMNIKDLRTMTNTCFLGTGTSEPRLEDRDLTERKKGTANSGGIGISISRDTETGRSTFRRSFFFNFGELNGNYSEIGFGKWGQGADPNRSPFNSTGTESGLFSKALIKNENGEPTVLTILEDEALRIYYTVVMLPDLTERSGNIAVEGNIVDSINYKIKSIGWGSGGNPFMNSNGIGSIQHRFGAISGIILENTRNALDELGPFDPLSPNGYAGGFASKLYTDRSYPFDGIFTATEQSNIITSRGIEIVYRFTVEVGEWINKSIYGLVFSPSVGTESPHLTFRSSITYVILFDKPFEKQENRKLEFVLRHGWSTE